MGIFSSHEKKKKKDLEQHVSEQDRAILELKRQRDRLAKYKIQLAAVIAREQEIAKEWLKKGNKKAAMVVLKKKKYQQKMMEQTEGQLYNLEEMAASIEFASVQKQVFDALTLGKNALQKINEEVSLEKVEQLMDESAEAIAQQEAISEALAGQLSESDTMDVEAQFAAMEEELLSGEVAKLPVSERVISTDSDKKEVSPITSSPEPAKEKTLVLA